MNTVKGSAKELFRQMKEELNYRSNSNELYDLISNVSSEGNTSKDYYNEMKYLKKDQLKAYICKLRKEIKNYKIKETNFIIEIKYLRRKVIRLKNVIENDRIFKYQRNFSVKNYERESNSLQNNFYNYNINNSEKSFKPYSSSTYHNNPLKSIHSNLKFKNFSIRSINDSIHNSRRRSIKNYDSCSFKYTNANNNKMILQKNASKSNSISSFYKDKGRYNNSFYMDYKNKLNSNDNTQKKKYFPNRSFSSISKFELKKHLISNNKNIRNLSSEINNIISKGIKNYYNSKDSILSNKNINIPPNKLLEKSSNNENYTNKNNNKITLNNLNIKEIKKNYNCDIYNYNYHQNILNKKYSSPYSFKKSKLINNNKKNTENIIKRNIENVSSKIIELPLSDNDSKKNNLKNNKISKIRKNDINSINNIINMKNDSEKIQRIDSTSSNQKIKTYLEKNSPNIHNEKNTKKKKSNKEKLCITKLKNKDDKKYSEFHNSINHIKTQISNSEKEEIKKKQNNLLKLKKNIDLELKENFRKELEQLKNRNNKLISKPNNFYNFSIDSSRSSSSHNDNNNNKINLEKKNFKYNINNNPLRESNVLNISFNDIDKRISNLQNYLKNTRK
ncbi:conserved Plasmodium protein, unknown function [Plasmodium gallinaceum]|uniref:Uncharacterized protein n=1 Tax=Plasmodium gallinaceum TaxID=5849 RepID=A0A1J1GM49_PLAGA|nr:conserved Plasmodium protein, unknown function [Plasmodium gallinaceum]CRG93494.1 conserved Plasmodium protein, unknown function [Plasmodium gallinaceum]